MVSPQSMDTITERLRILAHQDLASRVPIHNIGPEHYGFLARAISNVLSTELALFTYAQIIDGLPTADVAWDRRHPGIFGEHAIEDHADICPGVMDKARSFRDNFDPAVLAFRPKLVQTYQHAIPRTKVFNTCLIELVAVALHQIGTLLFQLDLRMHQGGSDDIEYITRWTMPIPPGSGLVDIPPRATLFSHHAYLDDDVYPEGVADVVGYWAEDRILGGVTVFDRRPEDISQYPPNVYFHACRAGVTDRLFQLRDEQEQALVDFMLAEPTEAMICPLPIIGDNENRVRINAEFSIKHFIYRDIWERKPSTTELLMFLGRRPKDELDYPENRDMIIAINRQFGLEPPSGKGDGGADKA